MRLGMTILILEEVLVRIFYKNKQMVVIYDRGDVPKVTILACILHQVDFDIFIPSSNEFEITVK